MSAIKNIVGGTITYMSLSAAAVIGVGIGGVLWEEVLEDKIRIKTQELFHK